MTIFSRFLKDESGATAIEYSLIAALMASAVIIGMQTLTPQITTAFTNIGNKMTVP
ncbi:MAG: Flp family type IVb pilin [Proteobacteria bacterium]|nr:Flp family type IVb pilin [Pseudomonadota bacterium]